MKNIILGDNKIDKNLVIIRTDGGICSQLAFCALGKYFEDKGYLVKYDITWFKENGKDLDGKFLRNYDIPKLCPELKFQIATDEEIKIYQKKYRRKRINLLTCKPPIYIDGYHKARPYLLVKYRDFFANNISFKDADEEQLNLLNEIKNVNSCGVHVRRGDIATSCCYGNPADVDYFLKTIKIINSCNDDVIFYFFSDEPKWIIDNIVPYLDGIKYKICDKNGSDKGYLDLYLLSYCKFIISSNGSLGYTAKLLSKKSDTQLWMCKCWDFICNEVENTYIINCPNTIEHKEDILSDIDDSSLMKKLFSIKTDKKHKILTILGIRIKIKKGSK